MLRKYCSSQHGVAHLLLVILALGALVAYLLVSGTFDFQNGLLNNLYPKPQSKASSTSAVYWGGFLEGAHYSPATAAAPYSMVTWDKFEATTGASGGKAVSILHYNTPFENNSGMVPLYTGELQKIRDRGAIPMVLWGSWKLGAGIYQPSYKLSNITRGDYDAYINTFARTAATWGKPFFLNLNHEQNLTGQFTWQYGAPITDPGGVGAPMTNTAADFVSSWRHVHNIFNCVADSVWTPPNGCNPATNVTWAWVPNIYYCQKSPTLDCSKDNSLAVPFMDSYPGDAYTDWVGVNGFNHANGSNGSWDTFTELFDDSYKVLTKQTPGGACGGQTATPADSCNIDSKPIMIMAMASNEWTGGTPNPMAKADWIRDAFQVQIPQNYPRIKAVMWFNWNVNPNQVIESSPNSIAAFAESIGSDYYSTNEFGALPVGTKILPLLTAAPTASPNPNQATIYPEADTYVNSSSTQLQNLANILWVSGSTGAIRKSYLKFDLSPYVGRTVSSATLAIKPSNGSVNPINIKYLNDDSWLDTSLIYSNQPNATSFDSTPIGVANCTSLTAYCNTTLNTSRLQSKLGQKYSIVLEHSGTADDLTFYSREETASRPQLQLTFAPGTSTPAPTATPAPVVASASFTLQPSTTNLQANQSFTVQVRTQSDTYAASLYNASLTFNPSLLEVTSVDHTGSVMPSWVEEFFDNTAGTLSLVGGAPDPGYKTTGSSALFTTITFRAKSAGSAAISFSNESAIYRNSETNENILSTPSGTNITITPAPTAVPTSVPTAVPTAAPTSAPTSAPTAAPTSAPTAAPTAAPTPTPVPLTACTITKGVWDTNQTTLNNGVTVQLKVNASGDCIGKSVTFTIREDDGLLGYDGVTANPISAILSEVDAFNHTFVATTNWVSEFQDDGFFGTNNPPEYYFLAALQGSSTTVTSDAPQLLVTAQSGQGSVVQGDLNQDGRADLRDLAKLYTNWNVTGNLLDQLDTNNDGALNNFDVAILRNVLRANGVLKSSSN